MATKVRQTNNSVTLTLDADEVVLLDGAYSFFQHFPANALIVPRNNSAGTPQVRDSESDTWATISLANDEILTLANFATEFRLNGAGGRVTFRAV
jgi:hypothetical protein